MTADAFGRLVSVDDRDRGFPMRQLVAAAPTRTWRYWYSRTHFDQGQTGTCVGHAWGHYAKDGPVTQKAKIDPIDIYLKATLLDQWPENDGNLNFGTSVRAGAKVLQDQGMVSSYWWAWDVQTVVDALLTLGPVVMGTNWYEAMSKPNSEGSVEIAGARVGGHAYLLNGVNTKKKIVRLKNSWGKSWSKGGYALLHFDDLERLLGENGEAAIASEVRV